MDLSTGMVSLTCLLVKCRCLTKKRSMWLSFFNQSQSLFPNQPARCFERCLLSLTRRGRENKRRGGRLNPSTGFSRMSVEDVPTPPLLLLLLLMCAILLWKESHVVVHYRPFPHLKAQILIIARFLTFFKNSALTFRCCLLLVLTSEEPMPDEEFRDKEDDDAAAAGEEGDHYHTKDTRWQVL